MVATETRTNAPAAARASRGGANAKRSGLIQSVSIAARVLETLSTANGPLTLSELARACHIGAPTAHRYLQSLIKEGLVRQDGPSGHYSLGHAALSIGLSALRHIEPVEAAATQMKALAERISASCGVVIWTDLGPVVVRWYRSARFAISTVALGDVLPLDNTACGLVFQAFLPPQRIKAARERQPETFRGQRGDERQYAKVRDECFAERVEHLFTSLTGKAAPIFDAQDELVCVVTTVSTLEAATQERHADAVREAAAQVCAQTGGRLNPR